MATLTHFAGRVWHLRDFLRLSAFDVSTPEGRAKERHRRIALSTLASVTAKLISVATSLISIPLALHYLGIERYGMWLTISSFITMLSFADLGIGNGLLNRVAQANGRNDIVGIRTLVSSGLAVLLAISGTIVTCFWLLYTSIPWQSLFNVKSSLAQAEAGPALAAFTMCFALSIPASMVQKVQVGLQGGFVASLWQCAGNLLSLAGIFLVTKLTLGLPWLVLALAGAPAFVALLNALVFFGAFRRDLRPSIALASLEAGKSIAATGWLFFLLQIVSAISYSSDPILISHILGPTAVPQYSVPAQLFNSIGLLISMGLAPLWPAYGEAVSRADHEWVRRTFYRSVAAAAGAAALGVTLLLFTAPTILHVWVGPLIHATPTLLYGLALWKILEAVANAFAMFLNGAHIVKFQVIVACLSGIAIFGLKFPFISAFGVGGAVWATIVGFTLFAGLPLTFRARSIISSAEE